MFASVRRYWRIYGGWRAFFTSSYLHLALVLAGLLYPWWSNCDTATAWADVAIGIMPSLMGFSIAGMAIMLAFSHPATLAVITEGKDKSFFLGTIINLVHFMVVQTTSLLLAVLAKAYNTLALNGLGVAAMVYAILLSIAAACQLFNTARIMNAATTTEGRQRNKGTTHDDKD